MLVLPPIPEKSVLKTTSTTRNAVRRHSIDAQFLKSSQDPLERQLTEINTKYLPTQTTSTPFKSALKSKFRDFNLKPNHSSDDDLTKLKVNFSLDEKHLYKETTKLPPISGNHTQKLNDDELTFFDAKLKGIKTRSAQIPVKQGVSLVTTLPARVTKSSEEKKSKNLSSSSNEYNIKKNYVNKIEKSKRSLSHSEKISYGVKKRKKNKKKLDRTNEEDDYEYVDETQQSEEVKYFISLVKRLQISDGQTPQPSEFRQLPKHPRLLTNLSVEGQYALMKTYEDTIANEILKMHPNLAVYVPRVLTSKFRKRLHQPKSLRFLSSRADGSSENSSSRETPVSATPSIKPMSKQNSFIQQPFPTNSNDPNLIEHQITVSQQLEIAQEILDLIKKSKGEYVTGSNLDENMDILKTYAAYVKIWTKYFHLR